MKNQKIKKKKPSLLHKNKRFPSKRLTKLKKLRKINTIPRIFFNESQPINEIPFIEQLIAKSKPFIVKFPDNIESPYPFFHSHSHKSLLQELSTLITEKFPNKVDANLSNTGEFSGDYHNQETTSVNFSEFLNYEGSSTLYLAQIPLYKQISLNDFYFYDENSKKKLMKREIKEKIAKINENKQSCLNLQIPHPLSTVLKTQNLDSINLWLSKKPTISQWHYDSYDNFLCMVSGVKKLRILSPKHARNLLNQRSITEPFYNQASEKQKSNKKQNKNKFANEITCEIKRNEAIFLPQGWYHHVESLGNEGEIILALSFWFNSIETQTFFKNREDYFLRFLLIRKSEREINKLLGKSSLLKKIQGFPPDKIRSFFSKIAKKPDVLQEFLLGLNHFEVEFFTNLLEKIDKKLPADEKTMRFLENGSSEALSNEISKKIDEFYSDFWGKIDYKFFLDRFLQMKKETKLWILSKIIENL